MAQTLGRLTALKAQRLKEPGMYADGGGLYLQVTSPTAKSWIYRYKTAGKQRDMGLGSIIALPLSAARAKAAECRLQRQAGMDPLEARQAARTATALDAARSVTFEAAALDYVASMTPKWRSGKHAKQWSATLRRYAFPIIGALPVAKIDTTLVLKCVEPIWTKKPETANRLRGRIELVLDAAKVKGQRLGENPARWRGHLDKVLPARSRVRKVKHHPALPYDELPAFMVQLRELDGVTARALEWTILTAARTNETTGFTWTEYGKRDAIWTIPAERMGKGGREHRVPLTKRALAIVAEMSEARLGEHVFPGRKAKRGLSNMAMAKLLDRLGFGRVTVHGFRSTFRDWAAEQTNFPRELAEVALSHRVGDDTERAYQRGDLLEKRRKLMEAWEAYCGRPAGERGKVVSLRAR